MRKRHSPEQIASSIVSPAVVYERWLGEVSAQPLITAESLAG